MEVRIKRSLLWILLLFSSAKLAAESGWDFLSSHGITIGVALQRYDYDYHNQMIQQVKTALPSGHTRLRMDGSTWEIQMAATPVPGAQDGYDFTCTFRCEAGELAAANVSVWMEFVNWSVEGYLLMPACAYNGNRFESRRIRYSPKLVDSRDYGVDARMIISDVPRLKVAPGLSRLSVRSGDLSAPLVGLYLPEVQQGVLIYTHQATAYGDNGLIFEERRDQRAALLSITAPVVREWQRYFIADNQHESTDVPAHFDRGDSLTLRFRIIAFAAVTTQTIFDHYFATRYDYWPSNEIKCSFPLSSCFGVQMKKFNEQNFVPAHGYYSVGLRENFLQDWQIGWTGGMISTYPLLFAGSEVTRQNVLRNFDWLFPDGLCPAGFFWDAGEKGTIWYGGDIRKANTRDWHLIRKSCDAIYYICKQMMLMEKMGLPIKSEWRDGTFKAVTALKRLWNRYGQFGQFINSQSGVIEVGGSTSAALAPAALVLAGRFFHDSTCIWLAAQSADSMYRKYVTRGITCGGPGDALQNPDSESSYAMLESFMLLYEHTQDSVWLTRAKEMAHQFATWVMPYDYQFPPQSFMGRLGLQTTGTVWANTQNKHAAPGICTYSGIALLRLFRASSDVRYLYLLRDIVRTLPQYLSHPLRPLPDMPEGWVSERINTTDWLEGIGEPFLGSTWAETALMLSYVELPGLYVVPEKDLVICFDQLVTQNSHSDPQQFQFDLSNPTATEAQVRLWIEHSSALKSPLEENYLFSAMNIPVESGETKTLSFNKEF